MRLGKLTKVTTLYRGLSNLVLPEQFWEANQYGVRGGVEAGFMSCTQDEAVAKQYAQADIGFVLEVQQGMVSRGADISWLSQYVRRHDQSPEH